PIGSQKVCSGDGSCVDCNTDDQCIPAGMVESFCFTAKCSSHACANTTLDGVDLPAAQQTAQDCHRLVCVQGSVVNSIDDNDNKNMAGDCTIDTCKDGMPQVAYEANNKACGMGATTTCDGMGNCVGCNEATDCPDKGPCQSPTCAASMCG